MAGGIGFPAVGFRFRDPQALAVVYQNLAHQIPGNLHAWAMVKIHS
jgi:hypothetical protein